MERVFPLRLASPLIDDGGLYKRERTLWHKLLSKKSKSANSEFVSKNQPRLKDMGDQDQAPAIPPAGGIRAAVIAGQAAELAGQQANQIQGEVAAGQEVSEIHVAGYSLVNAFFVSVNCPGLYFMRYLTWNCSNMYVYIPARDCVY